MTSEVQLSRRRGSSQRVKEPGPDALYQAPDLQHITVLTRAQWQRIQDNLHQVNRKEERLREAARQREAQHLRSKEEVKGWPNTLASQRQKKLEAKKIRDEAEEEKRKQVDEEESRYMEQRRKETIEKAKALLFYQSDRVKGLHGALMQAEVLKEREAQVELKKRIQSASKHVDEKFLEEVESREKEAQRREEEKVLQRRLERRAVAEELKNKIKEAEQTRERQKTEVKKDREENLRLQELHQLEQMMEEERQAQQKESLKQAHLEHMSSKDLVKAAEAQTQALEEEQRKLFLAAKQKMMKLRKEKEEELFSEAQKQREKVLNALSVRQQEQVDNEEQRVARAVAQQEAREGWRRRVEEERRAALLDSITAHRQLMKEEKEQRDKEEQQRARETLEAKREADAIFKKKQEEKARRIRDDLRKMHQFNVTQTAAKSARDQRLKLEEQELQAESRNLLVEEEKQFQLYARQVISAAADAQRNVYPLCKAAREGIGGGLGPAFGGIRPSYMVRDRSGAQMPNYVSTATQSIKELHESKNVQKSKQRLGFTWEN